MHDEKRSGWSKEEAGSKGQRSGTPRLHEWRDAPGQQEACGVTVLPSVFCDSQRQTRHRAMCSLLIKS